MNPLIVCSHVNFGYESHDAVIDATMELSPGNYLRVIEENGSGKNALIKGLLDLPKPTGRTLTVADGLKRTGIGYLPQQMTTQRDFPATVGEVVISGCLNQRGNRPFYSKAEKDLAVSDMEKLGILDLKKHCYRELSGGQQQRALIVRALCTTDKMLILDEPITSLGPSASQDFYHLIKRLDREEKTAILMVSHDIKNIVGQANKILHLQQNALFYGSAEEYQKSNTGQKFLGGDG